MAPGAGEAPPRAGPLAEDRTMNQLAPLPSPALVLPALIAAADERARLRVLEFFAVPLRNPHTRRAFSRAAGDRLEEHTTEIPLITITSYAVFCFKKNKKKKNTYLNN